ncbi:putative DNA binding domain-containing protein [Campylobacter sp. 9BO]|uniref:RNA-binding domain-containing protein n=1 Tax=Campylobacter sp. 9BO TaxID=3424759 RepID=UPI003D346EE9
MNISELIAQGESKTLEFKVALPSNDTIAKTAIAFANTSGGKLIIGIDDDKNIIGIGDVDIFALQDKIASVIFDSCSPNILPEIYTLNIDGKLLLVIEIFRGNLLPYYLKSIGKNDGTYIRVGATNRKADSQNITELERQRNNVSFDEEVAYNVDFSTLNISPLVEVFSKKGKVLDKEKLTNLKLIKQEHGNTYASNALLILLGYFQNCLVKCAKFKGTTMEVFIDKKEYSGDIFSILENTQNFILNHINLNASINGLYRDEIYEIPQVALREALINALIHRDYANMGRDVKVGIYDDIVNIVSPGGLPNSITQTDILSGRSEARNKVIANVFKELGLIEQWGSGINRLKSLCKNSGLKEPLVSEKGDFVDVEFYRPINLATTEKSDYDRLRPITTDYDRLETDEVKILKYLQENQSISKKQAMQLTGYAQTKIKQKLNKLLEKGLITRLGSGRSTYYVLS